ncbi:MAG: MFS transporter [Burkholderiales bacterium]|nr:MFS transporter [Burkholderiales bacterium]
MYITILAILGHMVLAGVRITTSLYALSLHASPAVVGSLVAFTSLLPMFLAVRAGRWQDRVGLALPLRLGLACLIAGSSIVVLLNQLWVLYVAATLVGVGFMMLHVASQNMVGVLSAPEKRAANFSWLALGFSTSGFLSPVISGVIIDHFGHHAAYITFCAIAVLSMALIQFSNFSDVPRAQVAQNKSLPGQQSFLDLFWHDKPLRHIYFIGILLASSWDLFTFVMPIYGTSHGFSASLIGFILGCFSAATFFIRFCIPLLTRYLAEWRMLLLALLITCLCFAVLPWLHSAWSLMALAFVLGIGLGASQPNILNLLHQAAPPARAAEAVGIRVTISNASQVVFPLAFGVVGASMGLLPVFLAMSAVVASGVPLVWRKAFH